MRIRYGPTSNSRRSPSATAKLSPVFERPVDVGSIPILRSHVIDGRPVLPMALILEWLAQGALQRNPGLVFCGVEDLRLLKGVIVRGERPETIRVLAGKASRVEGLYRVDVELRGTLAAGREFTHARGAVVLGDRLPQPEAAITVPPWRRTRSTRVRSIATSCSTAPS